MAKQIFHCKTPIRVRYAETDQMGVVYYANYLVWFEIGRTEFCKLAGFSYKKMEQSDGLFISVAEVKCRYHAPCNYDNDLLLYTSLKECRKRILVFSYEIYRQDTQKRITSGETVHVVTNRNGRPQSLPENYMRLLTKTVAIKSEKSNL